MAACVAFNGTGSPELAATGLVAVEAAGAWGIPAAAFAAGIAGPEPPPRRAIPLGAVGGAAGCVAASAEIAADPAAGVAATGIAATGIAATGIAATGIAAGEAPTAVLRGAGGIADTAAPIGGWVWGASAAAVPAEPGCWVAPPSRGSASKLATGTEFGTPGEVWAGAVADVVSSVVAALVVPPAKAFGTDADALPAVPVEAAAALPVGTFATDWNTKGVASVGVKAGSTTRAGAKA